MVKLKYSLYAISFMSVISLVQKYANSYKLACECVCTCVYVCHAYVHYLRVYTNEFILTIIAKREKRCILFLSTGKNS